MEIKNLILQSDQLRNDLRSEKELLERMNKPSEAIRYFEELMRSPRSSSDTFTLGHEKYSSSIKEEDSSNNVEKRNANSKDRPTCHHSDKLGHTANICMRKNGMQNHKPKFIGNILIARNNDTKHMNVGQR